MVGHDQAVEVLEDPERFTSWWGTRPQVRRPPQAHRPLHNLDPPEHTALRGLASRALERDGLAAAARRARDCAARLVEAGRSRGSWDVARVLAPGIATALVGDWLGLPESLWPRLWDLTAKTHESGAARLSAPPGAGAVRRRLAFEAKSALFDFFEQALAESKGGALALWRDGSGMDTTAVVSLATLASEAGLQTTADAICGAIDILLDLPECRDIPFEGRQTRSMIVEECLRLHSPIIHFARRSVGRTVLGGVPIPADTQVIVWFGAVNRDPAHFHNPHTFDPSRRPNPHLAFGVGPHRCLGAPLARRGLEVGLEAIWPLLGEVVREGASLRRASSFTAGFDGLRLHRA